MKKFKGSLLPVQKKLPKSYVEWLYKEVNKEDAHLEIPIPPLPKYHKQDLKFTETSKVAFASKIIKFIAP